MGISQKLHSVERLDDSEYSEQTPVTQEGALERAKQTRMLTSVQKLPPRQTQARSLKPSQSLLQVWWQRYRTRRQLKAMLLNDIDRLHDDLGISTRTALAEIRKPFWQGS